MRALIFALVLGASTATASARSTLLLGEATLGRELTPLTQFEASREQELSSLLDEIMDGNLTEAKAEAKIESYRQGYGVKGVTEYIDLPSSPWLTLPSHGF